MEINTHTHYPSIHSSIFQRNSKTGIKTKTPNNKYGQQGNDNNNNWIELKTKDSEKDNNETKMLWNESLKLIVSFFFYVRLDWVGWNIGWIVFRQIVFIHFIRLSIIYYIRIHCYCIYKNSGTEKGFRCLSVVQYMKWIQVNPYSVCVCLV